MLYINILNSTPLPPRGGEIYTKHWSSYTQNFIYQLFTILTICTATHSNRHLRLHCSPHAPSLDGSLGCAPEGESRRSGFSHPVPIPTGPTPIIDPHSSHQPPEKGSSHESSRPVSDHRHQHTESREGCRHARRGGR